MALAEIGARLRLQGAASYRRDAERAADSTSRLGREADQADRQLGRMGGAARRAGSALGSIGKAGAIGVVGAATVGIGALAAGLFQGFKDAAALQTMMGKTNAVIASTKGVANVSARGVVSLADSLESMSGVEGEAIINAQNLLLTFTKVRNGVGETNHIFDQATKAAVDMAVALGQDPAAAAMQLGKALNDPAKGVTALGKAGVSFSEKQKKTIKTLVESNRVMEAQKIILSEMTTQFGGAAKAAGSGFEGSMARAKDAIGDMFRDMATPLLPLATKQLERFSTHINDKLAPAMTTFAEEFIAGEGAGGRFRDRIGEVWKEIKSLAGHAQTGYEKVKSLVGWMRDHENVVKGFAAAIIGVKAAMMAVAAYNAIAGMAGAVAALRGIRGAALAARFALIGPYGLMAAVGLVAASAFWKKLGEMDNSADAVRNSVAGAPTVNTTKPKAPPKTITIDGVTRPNKPVVEVVPSRPVLPTKPKSGGGGGDWLVGSGVPPIIINHTTTLDGKVVAENQIKHLQDKAARK